MKIEQKLAAIFLVVLLGSGALLAFPFPPSIVFASTSNESENEEQEVESNDDGNGNQDTGEGGGDTSDSQDEPQPPMQTDEPPAPTIETPVEGEPITNEVIPSIIDEPPQECPEGYALDPSGQECLPENLADLGKLVGPPEECPTELGLTPLECLEKIVKEQPAPESESESELESPLEENQTTLPPSLQPSPSPSPDLEENQTIPLPDVDVDVNVTVPNPPGNNDTNGNGNDTNDDHHGHDKDKDVKVIIKHVNNKHYDNGKNHHHESHPEIDIIGLSVKENGNAMLCLINIDDEDVQCEDFNMPDNRVNRDFWRVIETDHDKNYDNGNTGDDDIDDVIDDLKDQDFNDLDDASNDDFDIDLVWVAINPQGDGVTCTAEDDTGTGASLCEPFKVDAKDVDGQITEGVEF